MSEQNGPAHAGHFFISSLNAIQPLDVESRFISACRVKRRSTANYEPLAAFWFVAGQSNRFGTNV
jgi:hypothetical protein